MRSPTTTPVPDEIFDYWLTRLGEAELKVLLYIVRRTLGFYKRADQISLSQFRFGIAECDAGTGLGKSAVAEALKSLKTKGLISAEKQSNEESGNLPTLYTIIWDPLPLSGKSTKPLSTPDKPPLSAQPDIQETVIQETVIQETDSPLPPASGGGEQAHGSGVKDSLTTHEPNILLWIDQESTRITGKGFHTTSPRAKRELQERDSPGLRSAISQILEEAQPGRNVTSLITGLVANGHRKPPERRQPTRFYPERPRYEDRPKPPSRMELALQHLANMKPLPSNLKPKRPRR